MISQRQTMKMQQKLSPQQLMLMQMLQLPVTELEKTLKEEVEKNPLLEITDEAPAQMEPLPSVDEGENLMQDADDDDYSYRERQERDRNQDRHELIYVAETSFTERLMDQLSLKPLTDRQRTIARELIGSLDDAGYLSRDVALVANDLAFTQGLEVSAEEVLEVLRVVQSLDPPGIGARTLQECLSLQLHRQKVPDGDASGKTALRVVDTCFDDFAAHNYDRIMERLGITEEELQEAIDVIRSLNPKPGIGDGEAAQAHYIIPDFIVTRMDETLHLALNDSHLPQLKLDAYYLDMLREMKGKEQNREAINFLQTNLDSANGLIETLRQRQTTMLRVMQVILRRQKRFFLTGDSADLKPLLQKDVAEQTGYDISTVSRVVNSKYVQTDFGTFLLKDCFSQGITTDSGDEVSTEAIRQELQQLVDAEDKRNPLTDDELSQQLGEKGYPVARRTVAKYREQLGIPVGRLRRLLTVCIMLLLIGSNSIMQAQQPQRESYYDSLMNSRKREGMQRQREAAGKAGKSARTPEKSARTSGRRALEVHDPEPEPTAIDSALAAEDELIDVYYDASIPPPSMLWYGRNLSGARVRLRDLKMDSLPDEITIRLIKGDEKFCFPVKNIITSPYGWRMRWNRPHRGVDIRLNTGDPVRAAFNGVVRIARPMGAYGNLVVVRHYNGLETVYGHLSKINVKPLQVVRAGQVLGLGGSTGRSTGPHLHFEVRFQYEPFDPEWILDFSNYTLRTRKLYLDKTYFGIRRPRQGETLEFKADKSIVPEPIRKTKTETKTETETRTKTKTKTK